MISIGVLFCTECGSALVDVNSWCGPDEVIIECADCGHESIITGFTVGKVHVPSRTFEIASKDVAVYHGDPRIAARIQERAQQEIEADRFD